MRRIKKTMSLILSGVLAFSMMPQISIRANDAGDIFTAEMRTYDAIFDGKADQYKGKTVILHSNDVHGAIAGYAKIAELEDDFEEAGAEVITVDAGDYSQGDPNVSLSKGASAISLMNAAGYEFSTLGNHEFDYGYTQLKSNLKDATFKVLCADILEDNKTIYDGEYLYTTKSGVKIGLFGMETPETASKANPALITGLTFINNTNGKSDLYDCAKSEVKTLKDGGADIVVALTHLGMDNESKGDGHRSIDMYNNVSGIDIILDGHSHDVMTEGPGKEPIQSTGTKFNNIGIVVIDDTTKQISDHYLVATEGLESDPTVEAVAKAISDKVDAELGTIFGKTEVRFASEKTENRCYETNTGDLITDAMIWEALRDKEQLKVSEDKVVAVINGGSIRAGLSIGDISKKNIKEILPFGNTLNIVYLKGSQLLEALEASTFESPSATGGFPQTKGINFIIDTSKEYDQGDLYVLNGVESTYYAPKTIQRVTIINVNGKAFDENETYAIITSDFLAAGGDTYNVFSKSDGIIDTGIPIDEVVSTFVMEELGGVLSAERYGITRGNQTMLFAPQGISVKKLSTGKSKMSVVVDSPEEGINGIQISYSTSKKFTDKTTKTVKLTAKKTKTTIKKLKSGKKYYVRVRTYAKVAGKTVYSGWSSVKSIKVK